MTRMEIPDQAWDDKLINLGFIFILNSKSSLVSLNDKFVYLVIVFCVRVRHSGLDPESSINSVRLCC